MFAHVTRLSLCLALRGTAATPALAQMVNRPHAPADTATATATEVDGPTQRDLPHVLAHAGIAFSALFRHGSADRPTARQTVAPFCAKQGQLSRARSGKASLTLIRNPSGRHAVAQVVRVDCIKAKS